MDVTGILECVRSGDEQARANLLKTTYEELHRIASARMRGERQDHTLTPTALVNEVSLKLLGQAQLDAGSRDEFLALAARAMRNLLVDYARTRGRQKRGSGVKPIALDEALVACENQHSELLDLNDALESFSALDERRAKVVELRYFGGLSIEDTASALGVSATTVKRDWEVAKAWLMRELSRSSQSAE